ncbi:MAG TPA: MgtC/SapB family protein [Xanthobacteraceae bacterium]|jgi:putative Mg2+ transporter-C (MgtC) family protein|nr:MgtC/SapB family protein [Xanthobacteraceae bacterium]
MSFGEILLRLIAAAVVGGLVGLNRDLHGKPTGVPTLGLVALGSALVVLAMAGVGNSGDTSRVIQGIVTGIGFLGAGVIIRPYAKGKVHGLTTAACVWLTAALGAACGLGAWRVLVVGVPMAFLLLLFGKRLERLSEHVSRQASGEPDA